MKQFDVELMEQVQKTNTMDPLAGHIRGQVIDLDGDGVRNTRVSIHELDRFAYTDDKGNFSLINLPPALYTLIAESEGLYSRAIMPDVAVERGDNPGYTIIMCPQYMRMRPGRRRGAFAMQM
jgi:hypothetical protein